MFQKIKLIEINKVLKTLNVTEAINSITAPTAMYENVRLKVVNEMANYALQPKYTDN